MLRVPLPVDGHRLEIGASGASDDARPDEAAGEALPAWPGADAEIWADLAPDARALGGLPIRSARPVGRASVVELCTPDGVQFAGRSCAAAAEQAPRAWPEQPTQARWAALHSGSRAAALLAQKYLAGQAEPVAPQVEAEHSQPARTPPAQPAALQRAAAVESRARLALSQPAARLFAE